MGKNAVRTPQGKRKGRAGLLLVVFYDLRRAHLCLVWVTPKLSQGPTLTQQIPALVEFDLYLP